MENRPDISKSYFGVYNQSDLSNYDSNNVLVEYHSAGSIVKKGTGDVYFNFFDDVYTVTVCGYNFINASDRSFKFDF